MALKIILEGTPASFPVQAFNAANPVYWEAGMIGSLDTSGNVAVINSVSALTVPLGLLADRRNTTVGIANANYLPSLPAGTTGYGDESLFNQPGMGNSLYGTTNSVNNVIPANTIPTTTLLRDETAANPNVTSRYVTVYIRGGVYATDQFDTTQTYVPGTNLYANLTSGLLTNQTAGASTVIGVVTAPVDGNGLLTFKLTLV